MGKVITRDKYKSRVVGFGNELNLCRTKDGLLHVDVRDYPNCTWVLEDDRFICQHDQEEIVEYVEDHMGMNGPYQTEYLGYACAECGEGLEGDPEEDRQDAIAEAQLMELLGK